MDRKKRQKMRYRKMRRNNKMIPKNLKDVIKKSLFGNQHHVITLPGSLKKATQGDKIIGIIYETMDYNKFKKLIGNRCLPLRNKVERSFNKKELDTYIVVNERMEIVDGQCRFDAWKKAKLPVKYKVCPGYGVREAQIYSNNVTPWKTLDWAYSYSQKGNKHYETFINFTKKYRFGGNETMTMLSNGSCTFEKFREGLFKVTNLKNSIRFVEDLIKIEPVFERYQRRWFVLAMFTIYKNNPTFNMKEFIKKAKQTNKLKKFSSVDEYLRTIEDIYNYRRKGNKIRLY